MEFKDTAAFKALEKVLPDVSHSSLISNICEMAFLEGVSEGINKMIALEVKG